MLHPGLGQAAQHAHLRSRNATRGGGAAGELPALPEGVRVRHQQRHAAVRRLQARGHGRVRGGQRGPPPVSADDGGRDALVPDGHHQLRGGVREEGQVRHLHQRHQLPPVDRGDHAVVLTSAEGQVRHLHQRHQLPPVERGDRAVVLTADHTASFCVMVVFFCTHAPVCRD